MRVLTSTLLAGLGDLLFPPVCDHCQARSASRTPLCWKCMRLLERVPADELAHILDAFLTDTDGIRLHCLWYFDKRGPLRDVVHALKYKNRPWYGAFLGESLGASVTIASPSTLVVPLPLHRVKHLERGYNQSEWIARKVAERLDLPLADNLLCRTRRTGTQTALKRDDRWRNVRNAFAVVADTARSAEDVLLIDDVVTTGATGLSAAVTLREAGFRAVTIAALGLART